MNDKISPIEMVIFKRRRKKMQFPTNSMDLNEFTKLHKYQFLVEFCKKKNENLEKRKKHFWFRHTENLCTRCNNGSVFLIVLPVDRI